MALAAVSHPDGDAFYHHLEVIGEEMLDERGLGVLIFLLGIVPCLVNAGFLTGLVVKAVPGSAGITVTAVFGIITYAVAACAPAFTLAGGIDLIDVFASDDDAFATSFSTLSIILLIVLGWLIEDAMTAKARRAPS